MSSLGFARRRLHRLREAELETERLHDELAELTDEARLMDNACVSTVPAMCGRPPLPHELHAEASRRSNPGVIIGPAIAVGRPRARTFAPDVPAPVGDPGAPRRQPGTPTRQAQRGLGGAGHILKLDTRGGHDDLGGTFMS
jgi:hypothetical protein